MEVSPDYFPKVSTGILPEGCPENSLEILPKIHTVFFPEIPSGIHFDVFYGILLLFLFSFPPETLAQNLLKILPKARRRIPLGVPPKILSKVSLRITSETLPYFFKPCYRIFSKDR